MDLALDELFGIDEEEFIPAPIAKAEPPTPDDVNAVLEQRREAVKRFHDRYNIMIPENRLFLAESTNIALVNSTPLESTMITLEIKFNNVAMREEDLIKIVEPTEQIPKINCNFGIKLHATYEDPPKPPKSKRGRKKKIKPKKQRKLQGIGGSLNSQITFVVRSQTNVNNMPLNQIPLHKIKVFRNGVVQFPGAKLRNLDDVVNSLNLTVNIINKHLHAVGDIKSEIILARPVMINYKYRINIQEGYMLSLARLVRFANRAKNEHQDNLNSPVKIHNSVYVRHNARMFIIFNTPLPHQPDKTTRMNIFMSGKVNILGAYDVDQTRDIVTFIDELISDNFNDLVVKIGNPIKKKITAEDITNKLRRRFPPTEYVAPKYTQEEYAMTNAYLLGVVS